MQEILGFLLIIGVPAFLLYVLTMLEAFEITRTRIIVFSLAWGVVAYWIAYALNIRLITNVMIEFPDLATEASAIGMNANIFVTGVALTLAPLFEEALKMVFILFLYNRTLARYSGDGLVYGFAVGSGFAIMENIAYVSGSDQALGLAFSRVVTTGVFHASITALVGAGVCSVIFYRRWITWPIFVVIYLIAVFSHWIYNFDALFESEHLLRQLGIVSIGTLLLILVFSLQLFIRFRSRGRILNRDHEGLTDIELMVVHHGNEIVDDLAKQAETIGMEQSKLLHEYLSGEAKIAFLTQNIIKGTGHRGSIKKVRNEIHDLREQVTQLKQQLSPEALNWLDVERKQFAGD